MWVEKRRSHELRKKNGKNRKLRDFRDISKISGTNVLRPDTYPEKKKSPRFSNGNFRRQKIFHGDVTSTSASNR